MRRHFFHCVLGSYGLNLVELVRRLVLVFVRPMPRPSGAAFAGIRYGPFLRVFLRRIVRIYNDSFRNHIGVDRRCNALPMAFVAGGQFIPRPVGDFSGRIMFVPGFAGSRVFFVRSIQLCRIIILTRTAAAAAAVARSTIVAIAATLFGRVFFVILVLARSFRFGVDQCLTIGNRDLVVIGMNFAERKKAVAIATIFHECSLKGRFDACDTR